MNVPETIKYPMDLRAFFKIIKTYRADIYAFLTLYAVLNASAFGASFLPKEEVPDELSFANVTFQLTEATQAIFSKEVLRLQKSNESNQQDLKYLSALLQELQKRFVSEAIPDDFKYLLKYRNHQASIHQNTYLDEGVFWCMDKGKAKEMGLLMSHTLDERKHYYKATTAAVNCFHRNQVLLNNWGSTLFAHLADKVVLQALETEEAWQGRSFLLLDTPAYASLVQFLAYKYVMESYLQTMPKEQSTFALRFSPEVDMTLEHIAASLRVELSALAAANKWIRKSQAIPKSYDVLVIEPHEKFYRTHELAKLASYAKRKTKDLGFPVLSEAPDLAKERGGSFFLINGKRGIKADLCDNFVTLAYKAEISPEDFLEFNEIDALTTLHVGRVYYLEEKSKEGPIAFHTVLPHQSIWEISHLYGIRLKNLLKLNRLEEAYKLREGRIVHLQDKLGKGEPIRYLDLPGKVAQKQVEKLVPDFIETKKELTIEEEEKALPKTPGPKEDLGDVVTYIKLDTTKSTVLEEEQALSTSKKNEQSSIVSGAFLIHMVQPGETLLSIANLYGTSVKEIFKMNKLMSSLIHTGQKLKVIKR